MRCFLDSFTLKSGISALLIGFGLALTHPVILAYGIFIIGVYISIVTFIHKDYKKFGVIVAVLMFTILPMASLRFVPSADKVAFDLESVMDSAGIYNQPLISSIEGTPFYGFNLERIKINTNTAKQGNQLQTFFSWSYLWILGLGFLWSVFNLKKNTTAPFIAAASLLVILCAIPYTGWLVGYAVSPRMLWRAPWLLPIGLIGAVLLAEFLKFILHKITVHTQLEISAERPTFAILLTISVILIGYFSAYVYTRKWQSLARLDTYRTRLEGLSSLGNYLENNIGSSAVFVAPPTLMDYLPGLSSKSKVAFFRSDEQTHAYVPDAMSMDKINLIFSQDSSILMQQRVKLLARNHIQYILLQDESLKDYYASYSQFFNVQKFDSFWILEFREANP
jgi:hypothetical protein